MSTVEQAQKFFSICDADADGQVTRDELRAKMEKEGKRPHEIDRIFRYCDRNHDGSIELVELTKALFANQWDLIFEDLDKDGSGLVDAKELGGLIEGREEDEVALQRFVSTHDVDGDGKLNRDEFLKFFLHKDK